MMVVPEVNSSQVHVNVHVLLVAERISFKY